MRSVKKNYHKMLTANCSKCYCLSNEHLKVKFNYKEMMWIVNIWILQ